MHHQWHPRWTETRHRPVDQDQRRVLQGAASLTDQVEFLDIPLTQELLDQNTIEVVPSGAADAEVTVVIRQQPS